MLIWHNLFFTVIQLIYNVFDTILTFISNLQFNVEISSTERGKDTSFAQSKLETLGSIMNQIKVLKMNFHIKYSY